MGLLPNLTMEGTAGKWFLQRAFEDPLGLPWSGDKRGHGAPFRVVTPATDCEERAPRSSIRLRSTTCVCLSPIGSHLEQERAKRAQGKRVELSSGRNCFPGVSVCVAMAWATGTN